MKPFSSNTIASFSDFGKRAKFAMQLATSESKYLTLVLFIENRITSPSSSFDDLHEKKSAISGFDVISISLVGRE